MNVFAFNRGEKNLLKYTVALFQRSIYLDDFLNLASIFMFFLLEVMGFFSWIDSREKRKWWVKGLRETKWGLSDQVRSQTWKVQNSFSSCKVSFTHLLCPLPLQHTRTHPFINRLEFSLTPPNLPELNPPRSSFLSSSPPSLSLFPA